MPFRDWKNKRSDNLVASKSKIKKNSSLQIRIKIDFAYISRRVKNAGRASAPLSPAPGSLVIEAALVLPLFLYSCAVFLWLLQVLSIQTMVEQALHQTSRELAAQAYAWQSQEEVLAGAAAQSGLSGYGGLVYIETRMEQCLADTGRCEDRQYYLSIFMDDTEVVDIVIRYHITLPVRFLRTDRLEFIQRGRAKAWTGYVSEVGELETEQFVYIAETGTVYHLTPECTHIRLSIQKTSWSDLEDSRNEAGGRYYPCERCADADTVMAEVYTTTHSDRYHFRASCSGLKRRVYTIPLSEAGGRKLCSRCGG